MENNGIQCFTVFLEGRREPLGARGIHIPYDSLSAGARATNVDETIGHSKVSKYFK